jgi:hypothetical protein
MLRQLTRSLAKCLELLCLLRIKNLLAANPNFLTGLLRLTSILNPNGLIGPFGHTIAILQISLLKALQDSLPKALQVAARSLATRTRAVKEARSSDLLVASIWTIS